MMILVLGICLMIIGIGFLGMAAPARLLNLVRWFDDLRGLYVAAGFRIVFGLALLEVAEASRWPAVLHYLGLFTFAAGFLLLFLGVERLHKIMVWWCGLSFMVLRTWALFAFLLGAGLVYALWGT